MVFKPRVVSMLVYIAEASSAVNIFAPGVVVGCKDVVIALLNLLCMMVFCVRAPSF